MVYGEVMQLGMLYNLSGNPKQTGQCLIFHGGGGDRFLYTLMTRILHALK